MTLADQLQARVAQNVGRLFPAASVLVLRQGTPLVEFQVGCGPDDCFDVASLTKVCATLPAILQLVAQDLLTLDAPAAEWLPALRSTDKASITVRQLLTHTSGLPAWRPFYARTRERNDVPALIAAQPLESRPGTRRCYSDLGFLLLGFLIEAITHQRIDHYCARHLYRPLGMTDIGFAPQHPAPPMPTSVGNPLEQRKSAEFPGWNFSDWRTGTVCGAPNDGNAFYAMHSVAGHAGLFATARAIATITRAQLPSVHHSALLPQPLREAIWTADAHGQGLGWWMNPQQLGITGLPSGAGAHFGFTGCFVSADPVSDTIFVLLTNKQQMGLDTAGNYPNLRSLVSDLLAML